LTAIYKGKGLTQELARAVAVQLTEEDALKAHMAEELGISQLTLARPVQASVSSALSFSVGAAIPLIAVSVASASQRISTTVIVALLTLVALGLASSRAGGAHPLRPTLRVLVGGSIAMAFTMAVGSLVGGVVL
jgi:VIT1/CCC1 family predicted Fe2+/Mn2+ transporter